MNKISIVNMLQLQNMRSLQVVMADQENVSEPMVDTDTGGTTPRNRFKQRYAQFRKSKVGRKVKKVSCSFQMKIK